MKDEIKMRKLRVEEILNNFELNYSEVDGFSNEIACLYSHMKYVLLILCADSLDYNSPSRDILFILRDYEFKKKVLCFGLSSEFNFFFHCYFTKFYFFLLGICKSYCTFIEASIELSLKYKKNSVSFITKKQFNELLSQENYYLQCKNKYILGFIKHLEMESQYFKFWVNKEAKQEIFENIELPSMILADDLERSKIEGKVDDWIKDQILELEKQFLDKRFLWEGLPMVKVSHDTQNMVEVLIQYVKYNINYLKGINSLEVSIEEISFRVKCLFSQIEIFELIIMFIKQC